MKRCGVGLVAVGLAILGVEGVDFASASNLSIYDVQYTTAPSGASPFNGQTHNVLGGVVTHIMPWSSKPRVYIQDPAFPAWGGVVIKDWTGGTLAGSVSIGDRIDLTDVFIEEASGTTTLQFGGSLAPGAGFAVQGAAPLPDALTLTAADLAAPLYNPGDGSWLVADHDSELYEGMLVTLENVTVGQLDLGKAADNYELLQNDDTAWAADFMNWDAGGTYHPDIFTGAELLELSGIVEQYVGSSGGIQYDYYQVFTRTSDDIVPVPEPATVTLLLVILGWVGRPRRY